MNFRYIPLFRLGVLSLAALWSGVAAAQLIPDGSFEASPLGGFSAAWTGAGDAGTVASPFSVWPATDGAQFAVMTTAPAVAPPAGFGDPLPGLPLFAPSIPAAALEVALGLAAGSLGGTVEGSGIVSAPFVVPVGPPGVLFDFLFATNEPPPGFLPFPDTAFVSIDGGLPIAFYDAAGPIFASGSLLYFLGDSGGYFTAGLALTPGVHTLAFGVVDIGDGDVSSG
ncbi:MAG: hypothetical protein WD176_08345, partial [Pirellulales bacterium]